MSGVPSPVVGAPRDQLGGAVAAGSRLAGVPPDDAAATRDQPASDAVAVVAAAGQASRTADGTAMIGAAAAAGAPAADSGADAAGAAAPVAITAPAARPPPKLAIDEELPAPPPGTGDAPLSGTSCTDGATTVGSPPGSRTTSGVPRPLSARDKWGSAGRQVKAAVKASSGFTTLRDMGSSTEIPISELKTVRKLGEGAFAVVEEAMWTPPTLPEDGSAARATRVAVKKLKPEIIGHEADLASFVSEIRLLRKLAHKRIVEYIGTGSTDTSSELGKKQTMFLVQEFMDGGTLKKVLGKQMIEMSRHIYSYEDAFRWAIHIAEGLDYLHSARPVVIHRDLKLENILLKGTNLKTAEAKISDFGLVAMVQPKQRGLHTTASVPADSLGPLPTAFSKPAGAPSFVKALSMSMRRNGRSARATGNPRDVTEVWDDSFRMGVERTGPSVAVLPPQQLSGRTGSYMYMAPEMYKEEQYNEKVDVFSYGVILFEVMARYQMVCAVSNVGTEAEIEHYAFRVSNGYRPPLPQSWPEPLRELIAQCWHQDPTKRPSMARVTEKLQSFVAQGLPGQMKVNSPVCACVIA